MFNSPPPQQGPQDPWMDPNGFPDGSPEREAAERIAGAASTLSYGYLNSQAQEQIDRTRGGMQEFAQRAEAEAAYARSLHQRPQSGGTVHMAAYGYGALAFSPSTQVYAWSVDRRSDEEAISVAKAEVGVSDAQLLVHGWCGSFALAVSSNGVVGIGTDNSQYGKEAAASMARRDCLSKGGVGDIEVVVKINGRSGENSAAKIGHKLDHRVTLTDTTVRDLRAREAEEYAAMQAGTARRAEIDAHKANMRILFGWLRFLRGLGGIALVLSGFAVRPPQLLLTTPWACALLVVWLAIIITLPFTDWEKYWLP